MKIEINRKFTGLLHIDVRNSKEQKISKYAQHYYDRMLRAYLKGKTMFQYGMEIIPGFSPRPIFHKVEYSLN